MLLHKSCRGDQNTHFMFNNSPPPTCTFYDIMWKNIVILDKTQMTVWHMCILCWIPNATNTFRICNSYCFSTATMVAWMHLSAMFILALPVLFLSITKPSISKKLLPTVSGKITVLNGLMRNCNLKVRSFSSWGKISMLHKLVQWNFNFTFSEFTFSLNLHYKFIVFTEMP